MIGKLRWAATKAISLLRTQAALDARLDEIQFIQGAVLTQLALNRQGTRLSDFEFKVFSQWGEDGIIQKLTRRGYSSVSINTSGSNAFCVRSDQMANCPFPALSMQEAFVTAMVREGKDKECNLTLLAGADRLTPIPGLPVVNVVTGETETL